MRQHLGHCLDVAAEEEEARRRKVDSVEVVVGAIAERCVRRREGSRRRTMCV